MYERDSIAFNEREYAFPVATALLWAASVQQNRLRVLDFGGALGTVFVQNRPFLSYLEKLKWLIVE